jgi:hypothetical protein
MLLRTYASNFFRKEHMLTAMYINSKKKSSSNEDN